MSLVSSPYANGLIMLISLFLFAAALDTYSYCSLTARDRANGSLRMSIASVIYDSVSSSSSTTDAAILDVF